MEILILFATVMRLIRNPRSELRTSHTKTMYIIRYENFEFVIGIFAKKKTEKIYYFLFY